MSMGAQTADADVLGRQPCLNQIPGIGLPQVDMPALRVWEARVLDGDNVNREKSFGKSFVDLVAHFECFRTYAGTYNSHDIGRAGAVDPVHV